MKYEELFEKFKNSENNNIEFENNSSFIVVRFLPKLIYDFYEKKDIKSIKKIIDFIFLNKSDIGYFLSTKKLFDNLAITDRINLLKLVKNDFNDNNIDSFYLKIYSNISASIFEVLFDYNSTSYKNFFLKNKTFNKDEFKFIFDLYLIENEITILDKVSFLNLIYNKKIKYDFISDNVKYTKNELEDFFKMRIEKDNAFFITNTSSDSFNENYKDFVKITVKSLNSLNDELNFNINIYDLITKDIKELKENVILNKGKNPYIDKLYETLIQKSKKELFLYNAIRDNYLILKNNNNNYNK